MIDDIFYFEAIHKLTFVENEGERQKLVILFPHECPFCTHNKYVGWIEAATPNKAFSTTGDRISKEFTYESSIMYKSSAEIANVCKLNLNESYLRKWFLQLPLPNVFQREDGVFYS